MSTKRDPDRLSSTATPIFKFVWPALWLGIVCTLAWRRLKHVELSGGALHVAGMVAREAIPLAAISAVTVRGDFSQRGMPIVRLHFRDKTHFGKSVDFIAASQQKLDVLLEQLGKEVAVRWR